MSVGATLAKKEDKGSAEPSVNALDELAHLVADDMAAVNALILERMDSSISMIPELAGYIVAAGGKRLRPLLTLAAAKLCGYAGDNHLKLAASVEFIHTATLLHDDVVDESGLRRGHASANAVFGNQASVLVGDFLFSRAFLMMVETGSIDVLRTLSNASSVIAEGEVLQLQTTNDLTTDEAAYLRVIEGKTAALFSAACRVGAVVAGRPREEELALEAYGHHLGVAFQLVDDVLDYSARQARLGKTVGDDFREGKMTLPVVLAYGRGSEAERDFWRRVFERSEQADGDLETAVGLMTKYGALADAMARARSYGERAREALLSAFPAGRVRQILLDVVDFVNDREF